MFTKHEHRSADEPTPRGGTLPGMATSSASLDRSPRKNWVENAGGLPPYIRKIARAIHEKRGIPLSEAIPFAIGRIKRWAAGGDNVTAETKAKAVAAIAAWEKLKGKAKLTEAAAHEHDDDALGIPTALLLAWADEVDDVAPLVEAAASSATPPSRLNVRLKSGRTVNVTADHARRLHRQGFAATDQRPGAGGGKFDEAKHPRGGKGSTSGGKFVAKGAGGTEVRAIQRRVGARVDGAFGDKTKAAVERFQRKHGLKVDGIVGRQTVAALRGRTDAKRVKVGKLSDRDRAFLTGHIRGRGGKRRTTLVEAVAPAAFLDRVQALEAGELARLPDGGAVKHEMTPDGREVWTSGRPSTYSPDSMSWDDQRRTVEEAVADALTRSAGATDPASLGGATRWTGTRCTVSGKPGRFVGVTATAGPLVRFDGEDDPTGVGWGEIVPTPRLVEASSAQT